MNTEKIQAIIDFLTEIREGGLLGKVSELKSEIINLKSTNMELSRTLSDAQEELAMIREEMFSGHEIELSGGTITVNIDDLNYMTKESFKAWCRVHAITNSEPVFNL